MSNSNIIIRKAEEKDSKEIDDLFSLIVGEYEKQDFKNYYVLTKDGKVVSNCIFNDYGEIDEDEDFITCHSYELSNFGTFPEYRKQGYGTMLFKYIYNNKLEYYKGIARLEWTVGIGAYEFWKKATGKIEGIDVKFNEACKNHECKDDCQECKNLDNYHDNSFDTDYDSHKAVVIKKIPYEEPVEEPGNEKPAEEPEEYSFCTIL